MDHFKTKRLPLVLQISSEVTGKHLAPGDGSAVAGSKKQWSDWNLSLLAVDGGVHPLDDSIDRSSSHYKGVMLEDTVNVETLHSRV
jgi:hypothetical protein